MPHIWHTATAKPLPSAFVGNANQRSDGLGSAAPKRHPRVIARLVQAFGKFSVSKFFFMRNHWFHYGRLALNNQSLTKRNNRFYICHMAKKQISNPIEQAAEILGGYEAGGRICGVTGKAFSKWAKTGKLPRTEATGETEYAQLLSRADPRIDKQKLLLTVMQVRP